MTTEIIATLDTIAEYQAERDVLALDKQTKIDAVLTDEIKAALAEIDAEYSGKFAAVDANIAVQTEKAKALVIQHGASVKGAYLHAVYSAGRVSWDSKKLDGMIAIIPAIADARKVGEPSVSLRGAK